MHPSLLPPHWHLYITSHLPGCCMYILKGRLPLLPHLAASLSGVLATAWLPGLLHSADRVYKDVMLPPLRVGDWLMFPNAGAAPSGCLSQYGMGLMAQPVSS